MENIEKILNKLESLEQRLSKLEKGDQKPNKESFKNRATISAQDIEIGRMAFVGRYESADGSMGSKFGDDAVKISRLFECNSFEMAQVIDAFSSEERINIIKQLIQKSLTARQLMEELNFSTTGKLYHHLSFLEKIGVIRKDGEVYHVSARYISCVLLIFVGVSKIIDKGHRSEN